MRASLVAMPKRPTGLDASQLAKRIIEEASGDQPKTEPPPTKSPEAVKRGQLGGAKGGLARKAKLSDERIKQIATQAAKSRWGQTKSSAE